MLRYLKTHSDEEHIVTTADIENELERCGISAGRKAVYEDIEALRLFGADIVSRKGKYAGYFLAQREFELPELKLLADTVSSSKFLTEKKSLSLIKKIESLASVYQGREIQGQIYVADRPHSINEKIYITIDVIQRAISENKKISFKYFDYNISKKKIYREDRRVCSPYVLICDNSNYYLAAYYEKYSRVVNFRADRIEAVQLLDVPADPKPPDFELSSYLTSSFSMFSGESVSVKLSFDNSLINVVLDRFGMDVMIVPESEESFTINVSINPQAPFYGWLFQFGGKVKILSPESVKEEYNAMLKNALEQNG